MTRLIIILAALALSACAALPRSAPLTPEAQRAAELARLLERTASQAPARLVMAEPEMAALERALSEAPQTAEAPEPPAPARQALAPPPDLSGARSLMHAVHLASYRRRDHARAGWASLQGQAPELGGLDARLMEADLGERGVFLRLKAGPLDNRGEADRLCAALQAHGLWCQAADFTGQSFD